MREIEELEIDRIFDLGDLGVEERGFKRVSRLFLGFKTINKINPLAVMQVMWVHNPHNPCITHMQSFHYSLNIIL